MPDSEIRGGIGAINSTRASAAVSGGDAFAPRGMTTSVTSSSTGAGLSVDGINVAFGGLAALTDVSLQVHPGEVVGVIGPNGAGKTTLFNIICGFVTPLSGSITYNGHSIDGRQ